MPSPKLSLSDLAATLRRVPLFADLSPSELELIAARITLHRYDAGTIIFHEGDPCRDVDFANMVAAVNKSTPDCGSRRSSGCAKSSSCSKRWAKRPA